MPLCIKINSSCTESYKNEPEPPIEPLSIIVNPANLTDGFAVFNCTMFVPIETELALIYCILDEPCTTKSFAM